MIKVIQPTPKVVILSSEYIDDGYTEWAPVITNVNIKYDAVNNKFVNTSGVKSIRGYNLHCATNITIIYNNSLSISKHISINPESGNEYINSTLYPWAALGNFDPVDSDIVDTNSNFTIIYRTKLGEYTWTADTVPVCE